MVLPLSAAGKNTPSSARKKQQYFNIHIFMGVQYAKLNSKLFPAIACPVDILYRSIISLGVEVFSFSPLPLDFNINSNILCNSPLFFCSSRRTFIIVFDIYGNRVVLVTASVKAVKRNSKLFFSPTSRNQQQLCFVICR